MGKTSSLNTGDFPQPIPTGSIIETASEAVTADYGYTWKFQITGGTGTCINSTPGFASFIFASDTPGAKYHQDAYYKGKLYPSWVKDVTLSSQFTYNNKTVYYASGYQYIGDGGYVRGAGYTDGPYGNQYSTGAVAWTMIYGESDEETEDITVPVLWCSKYRAEPYQTTLTLHVRISL